ncbi:MAG TPA: hypothetical protein VF652_00260 [Allosphingosinicella sp.]
MGFAYGTAISGPSGEVAIERLQRDDEVMAASLDGGAAPFWTSSAVTFSQGSGPDGRAGMVYIDFVDLARLICEQDQLFLIAEGRLVPAGRLHQGRSLLRPDGGERPIRSVSWGEYRGGIHGIATSGEYRGSPDGHLIAAGGVIAADVLLQLHHRGDPD